MANQILVQDLLEELKETKHVIVKDGQKKTMNMTCSFKNCGKETNSILEAFKHYEEAHTLIATATSSYFINQKKDKKKLFYYDTPKGECNVIEIARIKHPFNSDENFNKFLRSHYIKTNF